MYSPFFKNSAKNPLSASQCSLATLLDSPLPPPAAPPPGPLPPPPPLPPARLSAAYPEMPENCDVEGAGDESGGSSRDWEEDWEWYGGRRDEVDITSSLSSTVRAEAKAGEMGIGEREQAKIDLR